MPRLWIDTGFDVDLGNGASSQTSLMSGVSSVQTRFDQMTLLRTIVGIDLAYAVHDSGEGSQDLSLGIACASQEAFAATALADPEVDTDFPTKGWVWRARYRIFGFAADQPAIFTRRIDLDLRSKRKLENGECFMNFRNDAHEGTAAVVNIFGLVRQLWQVG